MDRQVARFLIAALLAAGCNESSSVDDAGEDAGQDAGVDAGQDADTDTDQGIAWEDCPLYLDQPGGVEAQC